MYYFISYTYRHEGSAEWDFGNMAIDTFPAEWLVKERETSEGELVVINWHEITREQYERYRDLIG